MSTKVVTFQMTKTQRSGVFGSHHLTIFTLGYQGVDVDTYVHKLKTAGVGVVADVRETPWSHKRGFCKNILSSALSKAGIEYVHVKSAGNPKDNRRTARSMAECLERYAHYLEKNPEGVRELIDVVKTASSKNQTVCLTCFEKDVKDCHRSILVDAMKTKIRLRPVHL